MLTCLCKFSSFVVRPYSGLRRARILATQCIAIITTLVLVVPSTASDADPTEVATSALEFGGSLGKLLWVSVKDQSAVTQAEGNRYTKLAYQIKQQIDEGRASSSLLKANFNVVATTLVYGAAVDPEPVSKAVAGVAAWGAKKTGDAIGQMVVEKSEANARGILAQGLKNSGLSQAELKKMKPQDLRARVADFQIGGKAIREILADNPKSLEMLQAEAVDIATNIGVENLARSAGIAEDVAAIKQDLAKTQKEIDDFQTETKAHLDRLDTQLSRLETAATTANQKLDKLAKDVQGNTQAIHTLAQISYSGWTTAQKLQAVQSGLFPELTPTQQQDLVESLKADQDREHEVASLQQAAHDFGNLAAIASNIGLPKDVIIGLQGAQIVATGIAQFATGDVLGSVSSLTSLVGLGAPDAAAERYAAMMKYLEQQFERVNKKLDQIIDLQVKTLQALAALAEEQRQFRMEVLSQLDRIESTVLKNQQLLQAILVNEWKPCYALINGSSLNGQFDIPSRDLLVSTIGDSKTRGYGDGCYRTMTTFLDAWVKAASWSGQIISADHFPTEEVAPDPNIQKGWSVFMSQRTQAYRTARDFLLEALTDNIKSSPAEYLARLSQPVSDAYYADQLNAVFSKKEIHDRLQSFKCSESDVLSPALTDLICFGGVPGNAGPPSPTRLQDLLGAAPLGPQSTRLIKTGITLSSLVDFATTKDNGSLSFVNTTIIENFAKKGPSAQLRAALREHKGVGLLEKLRWLAEADVLQQSIAYGNYTATLVERVLYDPATKSLNTDIKNSLLKQKALGAMEANPLLARNVVLLAMRHAIADSLGGPDKADALQYRQTYYGLALRDFTGPQACGTSALAHQKLEELLPKWKFEYRVSSDQKQKDEKLKDCPDQYTPNPSSLAPQPPERGAGVSVVITKDLYALAPSPLVLSSGVFEQSDNLKLALAYRDRVSQAIIDRQVADTVRSVLKDDGDPKAATRAAYELVNEGWGWQHRAKSE